jgi:hypothetical protein
MLLFVHRFSLYTAARLRRRLLNYLTSTWLPRLIGEFGAVRLVRREA